MPKLNHSNMISSHVHLFPLLLLLFLALSSRTTTKLTQAQGIKSTRLLDLVIRDITFKSYSKYFKTGIPRSVHLPANLSGIEVDTVRFRCGSLKRYGAKVKQFHLGIGVDVHPCVERVLIVIQNLENNWSSIYYDNYELLGYHLVSPVLGLLAYNANDDMNFSTQFEVKIRAGPQKGITVDFSNMTVKTGPTDAQGMVHLCATFGGDGKVTLEREVGPNVCAPTGHGHFGLVVQSPLLPVRREKARRWKIAFGSSVGAAIGALLLCLLLIALFVKVKKKARMEELERRAYEEEALQVSMVGHVRAHTARRTRTAPTIEHNLRPPHPPSQPS